MLFKTIYICYILKSLLVNEYYIHVFYNDTRQQRRDNEILDKIISMKKRENDFLRRHRHDKLT